MQSKTKLYAPITRAHMSFWCGTLLALGLIATVHAESAPETLESGSIALTPAQMDGVTAGNSALAWTSSSATAWGERTLALTKARTGAYQLDNGIALGLADTTALAVGTHGASTGVVVGVQMAGKTRSKALASSRSAASNNVSLSDGDALGIAD